MIRRRTIVLVFPLLVSLLAACSQQAAVVGIEQTGGEDAGAGTEFIEFDPAAIPLTGEAVAGSCAASRGVAGAFSCLAVETTFDPCFLMGDGRLMCSPNPADGTYALLVQPDGPLPAVDPAGPDEYPFFVELEGTVRTCVRRTAAEPVFVAGVQALYDCDAPYTYGLGFERSSPDWEAALTVLDPATGGSSGKVPARVLRAWMP